MSRPISESLTLLSETLGNCKTNLKEKEVADVDNIKISDVDEKIAEIQAGGGGNKATVTFSKGVDSVGSFSIYNNLLSHANLLSSKCVIDINVENSPYDMDNKVLQNSIKLGTMNPYYFNVEGEIKNGSGTITVTVKNGIGAASGGNIEPFLILVLRGSVDDINDYEIHVLFGIKYND